MEVIMHSEIARVVLAYLYGQKLDRVAETFCHASPYLREERNLLRRGYRPAMYTSLKLTDLFREYSEIQIKLKNFVDKFCEELNMQSDWTLMRKIDILLSVVQKRLIKKQKDNLVKDVSEGGASAKRRKRGIPSRPQSMASSSTPETSEPKTKRICVDRSFIVLNESVAEEDRNISNLSHISPIKDDNSSRCSDLGGDVEDEGEDAKPEENVVQRKDEVEIDENELELRKFPPIDLFSQTLLENESYPEKIADLINKGLETSLNQQQDPKEGMSASVQAREEDTSREQKNDQLFNFNFDEIISNIVNSAVKDPVFDDIIGDISSKANQITESGKENEVDELSAEGVSETPLKARLRRTCKKNYSFVASARKSAKKVNVISDVPFSGALPPVVVNAVQPVAVGNEAIQAAVSSTEPDEPAIAPVSTTQFYVIQPDNTTKLMDINQLQFPMQQPLNVAHPTTSMTTQSQATLVPITGTGIPENTYYINIPNYYLDNSLQLPLALNSYQSGTGAGTEQFVSNSAISIVSDATPSPDKFLIFHATTSSTASSTNTATFTTSQAPSISITTTKATIDSICATFAPIQAKPEIKNTPQNALSTNPDSRSASTPSRKAAHIRILNFHTPAKQSQPVSTPGSAPASVDHRISYPSRIAPKLEPIDENQSQPEDPLSTSCVSQITLAGDWDSVHGIGAITTAGSVQSSASSVLNTPRVSKDPRSCVRVLSRSASEDGDKPPPSPPALLQTSSVPPMVEIPVSPTTCRKSSCSSAPISTIDMDEWRRIRSVSKFNFDQHLRQVEEQRQLQAKGLKISKPQRKKVNPRKKTVAKRAKKTSKVKAENANESAETTIETDMSLTDIHGQMLEDALASAKKVTPSGKTPAKTPSTKGRKQVKVSPASDKQELEEDEEQQQPKSKIYVKITTPRKRTPAKRYEPALKTIPGSKSARKRRSSSSPKKKVAPKKEIKSNAQKTAKDEPKNEPKPVPEEPPPATPEGESPKTIKDHPKVQAKKSSPQKEEHAQPPSDAVEMATDPPPEETSEQKSFQLPSDCSLGSSLLLQTPFKTDLANFPITPRFLIPEQLQDTPMTKIMRDLKGIEASSSMTKSCEIQTPNFPITPGLNSTPKSINSVSPHSNTGLSSRRTDYSSGSSYYKPDESEDLDKKLEAMLHGDRIKRITKEVVSSTAITSEPELIEVPVTNEAIKVIEESVASVPIVNETPASSTVSDPPPPAETIVELNSSSSDSSTSSDSSSDSSSGESSPENTPCKTSPVTSVSPKKKTSPSLPTAPSTSETNRLQQQQAELEAKKQRTIARIKTSIVVPPPKKVERKFTGAPGFRARKVVVTRKEQILNRISAKINKPPSSPAARPPLVLKVPQAVPYQTRSTSASAKRKNPTPRKIIQLHEAISPPKKPSPKRKARPPQLPTAKKPEPSTKVPTVKKIDQLIEGTYENENLTRLCYTPDHEAVPSVEADLQGHKKQVYSFRSPERGKSEKCDLQITPDSNKENHSLEAPTQTKIEPADRCVVQSDDDEEEEDDEEQNAYDECSFKAIGEDSSTGCYFHFVYNEKQAPRVSENRNQLIKKCNVVLDSQKICLDAREPIPLFEQQPKKAPSSPKKVASTVKSTVAKKAPNKPVEVIAPNTAETQPTKAANSVETRPVVPTVRAKFNVISANRCIKQPSTLGSAAQYMASKGCKLVASSRSAPSLPVKDATEVTVPYGMHSPKMPLKLDMKMRQQAQQQQQPAPVGSAGDASSQPSPPPSPTTSEDSSPKLKKLIPEYDIAEVLTHIHG
ncbi:titin [Wyeomyia smithii]|uniref:titin n=1 Tax=Wyeomyia smithii TaxID=174621 RepID=UPI0024680759|nr:titin [Wyeomyia smithii]